MNLSFRQPILIRKSKRWTTPFDAEYLDETSEFKAVCDELHLRKKGESYTPKAWESLSYLTKENLGQIHAAGFIRTLAVQNSNGTCCHFESLSNDDRKHRLSKAWCYHEEKFPPLETTHHRMIFSLSQDFHGALVKAGMNPDQVLHSIVKKTMQNFSEKFHEGDSLGYCYGFHHDTDNLHAHVFIHPRTRGGDRVSFSSQLKLKQLDPNRADKLGFVKDAAQRQVNQWIQKLESKPAHSAPRKTESLYFRPKHAPPVTADVTHNMKVRQVYQSLASLDRELERRREALFKKSLPVSALTGTANTLIQDTKSQPDELKTAQRVVHSAAKSVLFLAAGRSISPSLPRQIVDTVKDSQRRQEWREFRALQQKRHDLWLKFRALSQQRIYGFAAPVHSIQAKVTASPRQSHGIR